MGFNFGAHWKKILLIVIALVLLFIFRPWFHEPFMFVYTNPIIIEVVIVWLLLNKFVLSKRSPEFVIMAEGEERTVNSSWLLSVPVLVILLMAGLAFSTLIPPVHVVNELEYTKITDLPETTENLRLMPYEVAYRYAKDSLQLSQYKLGTQNIAADNGKLTWMFPLIPDGFLLQFLLENKGVVFVDATTQKKSTEIVWKDLKVGEGMQIFNNLWWHIYSNRYAVDYDDPFYIAYNDEIYTAVPSTSYSFHVFWGLFYTVPRFDGITLIDSLGNAQFLTPEEALDSPILENNRIFPEDLSRYYIEAYVYHKGLINAFFIHEDQIDIQDVGVNWQPFLMDTSDGLKWFISTEPFGESHGVFKIFLVDAQSGEIEMYELPADETLTGPIKAMDFVRRSNPVVDWGQFKLVEPLPFIENDELYWKVVVVPRDAAGIAYQAFVNSETNEVIELTTNEEIEQFVRSGIATPIEPEQPTPAKPGEPTGPAAPSGTNDEIVEEIEKKLVEIEDLLGQIKE